LPERLKGHLQPRFFFILLLKPLTFRFSMDETSFLLSMHYKVFAHAFFGEEYGHSLHISGLSKH